MANRLMEHFEYDHLRHIEAREVSRSFKGFAEYLDVTLSEGVEKSVAMRKLLEGKDAGVRAVFEAERKRTLEGNVRHQVRGETDGS